MANVNCRACEDIRANAPNLIVNGLGDTECNSLKNDTGLNPSSGHNDCTDLHDLNDCLVGNMEQEVEAYDVCDWKEFMKQFIPNQWTTSKGIICAICGIWTNIHSIWNKLSKHDCMLDKLTGEISIYVDGLTEADLGTGVQWRTSGDHDAYPSLKGNACVLQVNGSLKFVGNKWLNFTGNTDSGNWLVYRYKINKAKYGIKKMWSNTLMSNNAGTILAYAQVYDGDSDDATTPGQWGWDDTSGVKTAPPGWIYLDIRISSIISWGITGSNGNITLTGVVPIVTSVDAQC